MKAVTIRGVAPEVAAKLKAVAAARGKSVNQLTLDLIKEGLGMGKESRYSREYHDLDDLFGSWRDDEYGDIQTHVDKERRIDPELWK